MRRRSAPRQLLVSIHDVMPATLDRTGQILDRLRSLQLPKVTLLVVPGLDWRERHIRVLRAWADDGVELAGHGWAHTALRIGGVKHWVHSKTISRNAAEHLALDGSGILRLVVRCYAWFSANNLPVPELYVPPAWALGDVSRQQLRQLPFRQVETMTGIISTRSGRTRYLPMVGFEADNGLRALSCRAWNRCNLLAAGSRRPLRLAIHPQDFELQLRNELRKLLETGGRTLSYREIALH